MLYSQHAKIIFFLQLVLRAKLLRPFHKFFIFRESCFRFTPKLIMK